MAYSKSVNNLFGRNKNNNYYYYVKRGTDTKRSPGLPTVFSARDEDQSIHASFGCRM